MMTTDLWMLVNTALLALALPFVYAAGRSRSAGGFAWGMGNRAVPIHTAPWVDRAVRAHQNLIENLAPFAILVLVAHVAGKADGTTALGASMFFHARVAHAAVYTAGIVYLRTAVFFVGWIGELLILLQLLH